MSVDVEVMEHVATIMLNRPEAMNSIDPETRRELWNTWERIREDDDIHVAVITGTGDKAFCVGSDLKKTMPPKDSVAQLMFGSAKSQYLLAGLATDKPLICAINGYAFGGGMAIAMGCDIRIASDNAQFALPEVKIGSFPGTGGTQKLPRFIRASDAMLMILTGERIDAAEALRVGLVSKVVPRDQLLPTAQAIARRISQNAPLAVRAIKHLVHLGMSMPLTAALEAESYVSGLMRDTEDRIEARRAFKEKRPPVFCGR